MLKENVPTLIIPQRDYQDFSRGANISLYVSESWNLQRGDQIRWRHDSSVSGIAEVLSCTGDACVIRKVS